MKRASKGTGGLNANFLAWSGVHIGQNWANKIAQYWQKLGGKKGFCKTTTNVWILQFVCVNLNNMRKVKEVLSEHMRATFRNSGREYNNNYDGTHLIWKLIFFFKNSFWMFKPKCVLQANSLVCLSWSPPLPAPRLSLGFYSFTKSLLNS